MKIFLAGFLAISLAFTAGCNTVGPWSVSASRNHYNTAIQQTNAEQLLANLVRLHYRDSPYFLEVASVSAGVELGMTGGGTGTFPNGSPDTWGLNLGANYKEKPTVTYTPLQGEDFAQQLLEPVSLDKVLLLVSSGWSISRVFRLCVRDLNGLPNAPSAEGPTPTYKPRYEKFLEAVSLLRELEVRGQADLVYINMESGEAVPAIRIAPDARDSDRLREFCELLGVEHGKAVYPLSREKHPDHISVTTRSVMASLFYLSQGIESPAKDVEKGRVTVTTLEDGGEFEWEEMLGDLFTIRNAKNRWGVKHSTLRAFHQGHWFYIEPSDLESKSTFLLLQQLVALQAGVTNSSGPVLTLPVSN